MKPLSAETERLWTEYHDAIEAHCDLDATPTNIPARTAAGRRVIDASRAFRLRLVALEARGS